MEEIRIGVYVCHCGSNIADKVDCPAVAAYASQLPHVVVARDYQYMCSDPGQELIRQDIKELKLNRVVVASCSPRMHEPTFRKVCESAGLNGYLYEMANIREHCSWVTEDPQQATEKAKALVRAAVARVVHHEPLFERWAPVNPNILVVGGGIAGIEAALKVAAAGNKVWLVEKSPSIGGNMARLDKTFPTLDCSACILTPKMVSVAQDENITLLTYAEVEQVEGYVGNFRVTIRKKARSVDLNKCTGCGRCQEKCPVEVPSEFEAGLAMRKAIYTPFPQAVPNKPAIDREHCRHFTRTKGKCRVCFNVCQVGAIDYDQEDELVTYECGAIIVATGYGLFDPSVGPQWGYGRYDDVITAIQFERLVNASGPTKGKVVCKDGRVPERIAILHCIGSRDENYHPYCSRICCMASLKLAHLAREKTGAEVYNFYIDLRAFGKGYEEFYNRILEEGVNFIRGKGAEVTQKDGRLVVRGEDTLLGRYREVPVDLVILNTALEPQPDATKVAQIFGIQRSADGFFLESHPKLEPLKTATDGVFIAGCCQGPKDIPDSVAQGAGAAAEALSLATAGKVKISPVVASIDPDLCSGCRMCLPLCPYGAISFNEEKKVAEVNETLCKGCGTCAASCGSGALNVRHFTRNQILTQIEEVLAV
ncbi:MAG: CoB--CoM heterodisulfide reductase iron-sulfur subunit A family protein [Clostridia bacterium]|nr:CoB--CoM heterodisulfide reductase iron-sulfur subunit A family protein [Clostridia bacterium]